MRYFRHAPTTYWFVVCVLLVAVTLTGVLYGREAAPMGPRPETLNQASQDVFLVRARVSDIHRVAAPPSTGLQAWSEETARQSDALAAHREGIDGEGDDLAQVYRALAEDARVLSEVDPSDTAGILTGVRLVEADADALVAVLNGATAEAVLPLPVEDFNVTEEAPYVVPGEAPGTPGVPAPGIPGVPQVPVIPATPGQPGTPAVPVVPATPSNALTVSGGTP